MSKICAKNANDHAEPIISTELDDRQWELGILRARLNSTLSLDVINHLSIFARHGYCDKFAFDVGPQYASRNFREFMF
ncbi:hypothetical protein MAR_010343 [Mya arenaria]|uniref:Uncharacterized protein n=1 Tax=Mya arenaria TaxID=6604 RepID=A0ABY7E1A7_MYAAR|nr:hypothetical protein MAR_010343 [Mya arenaria]